MIALSEVAVRAASHRVDQIVSDIDAIEERRERLRFQHVRFDDLTSSLTQVVSVARLARHRPYRNALSRETLAQKSAYIAGGAGDRNHLNKVADWRETPRRPN